MTTETLLKKQLRFTRMTAQLLTWAHSNGYEISTGDGYRDPRVFGPMGTRQGYGESKSAHKQRLAHDWNLFRDGVFLQNTEDHKPLGVYWESLGGTWGGRFNDGNHYSLEHDGIA
jgi:hypothetical protein